MYASVTGGIVFSFCLAPLFFEYTVELAYPVSEGLVGGFLCCFNNFIGTVFLALFFIPNLGTIWMNYVQVFGAVGKSKAEIGISNYFFLLFAVSIPAVILTKESYRRLDLDVPASPTEEPEEYSHPYSILT